MKRPAFLPTLPCLALGLTLFATSAVFAQVTSPDEPDERTGRYLEALVKRPTGGPLFDRFYQSWLDQGTLDGLEAFLVRRADADGAPPAESLLLAWFYAKRGDDNEAIARFKSALEADPGNAAAWLEKAKVESRLLDFDAALADLDRALAATPGDELGIEITKLKGRLLSRSGRGEEALAVWKLLAADHADDGDLQEDLVDLHLAEGMEEEAVALMESLVSSTRDSYDRVTRQLRLADLHQRAGEREKAVALYDTSLETAGRETWLETEILSQLERAFRREDDLAGLRTHLANAVEKDSGRIALRKRHAAVLAELGEADDALAVFQEVLKLTPGDRANREAFVELLGRLDRPGEAAKQVEALVAQHPGDAELLAQLALWRHSSGQREEAQTTVGEFLEASDGSEYTHLRAARMLEQFEATEAADGIFQKMVMSFPDSLEAKEARAEFLHRTGKKEEAVAIWKHLAATGSASDAHRAARALASRGEHETAYEILKSRVGEFETDFIYLGHLGTEAAVLDKYDEALAWAEKRLALAQSSMDLNDSMRQILPILERLKQTEDYLSTLSAKPGRSRAETCLLAEMLERNGQFDQAEAVLAPELEKGDLLAIVQQVRLFSTREEWSRAAETQLRLIETAEGRSSANVQELVRLLGRSEKYDEAFRWIAEWKKLSPGAAQPWTEQAYLLLQMDQPAEAVATLKSATRRFEESSELRAQLAHLHLAQGQHADAEMLYWQLYEEGEDLNQQLAWVGHLANVAADAGRTQQLVERFEERRRTNRTSLAPLLAIAEIHRRDGDSEKRREALREATKMRPEDLALLSEIARIEEQEGDWEAAVATLESALTLDKTDSTKERIALLVLRYGDEDEGYRRLADLAGNQADANTVLALADAMIARSDWERAASYLSEQRTKFPDDYRFAYLHGIALVEELRLEEAEATFLELLDWKTEIAKPATAVNQLPSAAAASANDYYKGMPEGMEDLSVTSDAYSAFQYRQALQQRSGQYRFNLGSLGTGGSSGIVRIPTTLAILRRHSIAHLVSLGQSHDEAERDRLGEAMLARGVKSADLLLELPLYDPYRGNPEPFPLELLDRYPDRLALWAMAVINHGNVVQGAPGAVDVEVMKRCYGKFRDSHPQLAFCAAAYAAASGSEDGSDLLETALAELPPLESLGRVQIPLQALSTAIGSASPLRGRRPSLLPDSLRKPLIERYRHYQEIARNDPEVRKQTTIANSFHAVEDYGWMLRSLDDLDAFADYLDAEIDRYEEMRRTETAVAASQATMLRQIPWITQNSPFLSDPLFPPRELNAFPPNVLIQFVSLPNYEAPAPIAPEAAARQAGRVRSPVLRALFFHLAGDETRAGAEIDSLLGEVTVDPAIRLQRLILGVGWFGAIQENPRRAIPLLEEARGLTKDKALKQGFDAFLVMLARKASSDAAEQDALLSAGRDAAIRLQYGLVGTNHRQELVGALRDLGLADEADRLERKAAPRTSASPTRTVVSTTPQGLYDRVKKLADDGDLDQAVKLAGQSLRASLRQISAASGAYSQIDYELIRFLRNLKNQKLIYEGVGKALDPGDPAAADPNDLLEWATFQLVLGEFDPALASYRAALGRLPERRRKQVEVRIVSILAHTYPKNAANHLAQFDSASLAQFSTDLQLLRQSFQYFNANDLESFRRNLNLGRSFTAWIDALDESAFANLDLSSVDYTLRFEIAEQVHGNTYLPGMFRDINPRNSWGRDAEGIKSAASLATTRREVHDALCLALLRSPQFARTAFSCYIGLRLHEDADAAFSDPANREHALRALRSAALRYRGAPARSTTANIRPDDPSTPRWAPEEFLLLDAARTGDTAAAGEVMKLVKATRQRDLVTNAAVVHDLAFGDASAFATAARKYLGANSVNHVTYSGNNRPYATEEALALPDKLLAFHKARGASVAEFDLTAFAADLAKKGDPVSAMPLVLLAEQAIRTKQSDLAKRYLDLLTSALLGESDEWKKFRRDSERQVNSGGTTYYQGGEFTRPDHQLFAALMRRLCNQGDTLFAAVAHLHENGLDTNGQVTRDTLVPQLATPRLSQDPAFAVALLDNPVFMGSIETFRTLEMGSVNVLRKCLETVAKNGPAKTLVRETAAAKRSYGGDLVAAFLSEQPKVALAAALGKHRAAIETKLDDGARADLAMFVNTVYGAGGADYETIGADAGAVLEALGTARQKTAKESAAEFLAVTDFGTLGINRAYDLEGRLRSLMQPLWMSEEWDTAIAVYWHGVDLVRKQMKRGAWPEYSTSGWNLEGDTLYDIVQDAEGSDLGRIALFHRIVASDKEGRIPHYVGVAGFEADLRGAFNRAGGEASLEEALDQLAGELYPLCGEESALGLADTFERMILQMRPALVPRALAWADDRAEGRPWSPLARETGHLIRLSITKNLRPDYRALEARIPDPARWQAHFVSLLADDSRHPTWRVALADKICNSNAKLPPEVAHACASALADAYLADSPMNSWQDLRIQRAFSRQPKTPAWETLARRLAEGWTHKNRNNGKPTTSGLGYRPFGECVFEALQTHLVLGDKELVRKFLAEKNAFDRIKSNARLVHVLVKFGEFEEAGRALREGFEFQDIVDDYTVGTFDYQIKYSQAAHDQLSQFLPTVSDPVLRYFAELIVMGAHDPAPEDREEGATYPTRGARLSEAAKRFAGIDFSASSHGLVLKERCLQQVSSLDPPASVVAPILEKSYTSGTMSAYCALTNYKKIEHGSRPIAAHAALRFRKGDISVIDDLLAATAESTNNNQYYRREVLEHITWRLVESLKHRAPNAPKEELDAYATALGRLLAEPAKNLVSHDNLTMLIGAFYSAAGMAGRESETVAWGKSLSPERAETLAAAMRAKPWVVCAGFPQIFKTKAPDPKVRPGLEKREAVLRVFHSCPLVERAYGGNEILFKPLIESGILTEDETLAEPGNRLAEQFPRSGWAAAELARMHADKGQWETAMEWSQRSLGGWDPIKSPAPYTRIHARHIDLLLEAKHDKDAAEALAALTAAIDESRLPDPVREILAAVRKRVKP